MTTRRRTFITGLMASALAPALPDLPAPQRLFLDLDGETLVTLPRYIIAMGGAPAKLIRWSAVEDFTNWDPT